MSQVNLGQIVPFGSDAPIKDAIHVPVVLACANTDLSAGDRIRLTALEDCYDATFDPDGPAIVDPFLQGAVRAGKMFWAVMLPGTVTNLRHHWTHESVKDFADAPVKTFDEQVRERFGYSVQEIKDEMEYMEGDSCRGCY